MSPPSNFRWGVAVPLVAAILVMAGAFLVFSNDDGDGKPDRVTVTVNLPGDGGKAPGEIRVPTEAVEQAEEGLTGEAAKAIPEVDVATADHTGLVDESPEGVPGPILEDRETAIEENQEATEALPTAGASAGFAGCRTQFVQNQSGRRGVRPTVQVLHYTVSPNRPGWSDVDGITAFFNRSSSQASSHFVIDAEGNCAYIVPIEAKAWTQAGGNPFAISYEIIATGRESGYLGTEGFKKLQSVMSQVSKRAGIPLREGRINGCAPSVSGIVQHADGGTCWGGHHDIGPFSFTTVLNRVTSGGCDLTCDRKKKHIAAHRELRARGCAPPKTTRSERCKFLHRRLAALHKAGVTY